MIDDILIKLNRVRGIGGALVLTADGQVVSGVLRQEADDARLAAAVGTLLGHAQRLAVTLRLPAGGPLHVQGELGGLLAIPVGKAWLAIVIDPGANLALLQLEARPFTEQLAAAIAL
ncbi:MAG: hypothetical protein RLZZ127_408 [Planctomycetota bacterium]|jgi:predicted regulator of Ras-like GTPase activity (Roadblock/LC7/MglB family)